MPTIPAEPHRPSRQEVIIDLLASISLEEIALSHLMNAEAEKIQAYVGKYRDSSTKPSTGEVSDFNKGVCQFLETIIMKEWLLLRKLENIIDFSNKESHHCQCKKNVLVLNAIRVV